LVDASTSALLRWLDPGGLLPRDSRSDRPCGWTARTGRLGLTFSVSLVSLMQGNLPLIVPAAKRAVRLHMLRPFLATPAKYLS
jgi:hypothetical protein